MTKVVWGATGNRFYETGVDRGVLYVGENTGVAWNGLASVSETPTGGEAEGFYVDGVKYLNLSMAEEYEAVINAFSAPREFAPCEGSGELAPGVSITQQPRRPFNFSYRTLVGNDVDGSDHGYKLHLVYNALANPTTRNNETINASTNPLSLSWKVTATPPMNTGFRPSAHLVIDSRYANRDRLAILERVLYGDAFAQPQLPWQQPIIDLLST